MIHRTTELLAGLDLHLDPDAPVRTLDLATQQLIVVARSLARGCRVLILDEPTAMLTPAEADRLFTLMDHLKTEGTMLYVSHRMPEVFRLADHIQVLRDGAHVASWRRDETAPRERLSPPSAKEDSASSTPPHHRHTPTRHPPRPDRPATQRPQTPRHTPLELRPGEILGIAGLPDSGRIELLHNIFGADPGNGGTVELGGEPYDRRNPITSVERRLAFVPGERRAQGLLTTMSVGGTLGALTTRTFSRLGLLRRRPFNEAATTQARQLRVKTATMTQPITSLSGGNQQKAVLARWLAINPQVLILDEPTRGVDIGAKAEIYAQLAALADQGLAILCSSSDLPELLTLTDRIAVMSQGRLAAVVDSADATEESVMTLATGTEPTAA
ncbi:ATP-binding cassette domain-containing protein OS=Streptomyces rutgersensis OX=53451 GN=F0345_28580 PE=4 SV=1 [Streptomyces diastaticus subsp. diastaticus]